MDGVKRKLASRQGVTFVFAMVVFLILATFSAELMTASIAALQDSVLLRDSEKAYASVNSVARLIQESLKAAPDMKFAEKEGKGWTWESLSKPENKIVQEILIAALNAAKPMKFRWSVKSDGWPELEDAFTDVLLTVTAEYRSYEELADFMDDNSPCRPTVVIRFFHPDCQMTMRIAACSVKTAQDAVGYDVKFVENDELDITLSPGAS